MKDIVKDGEKSFKKTRLFGNWKRKTIHRNKKAYNRQTFKKF